jgi:hypothetical protein
LKTLNTLETGVSLVPFDTGLFLVFQVDVFDGENNRGNNKAYQNKTEDGEGDNFERDFFDQRGRCHCFFILKKKNKKLFVGRNDLTQYRHGVTRQV